MEYQKRLQFINYIKNKFIDSNPDCKRLKGFCFSNYDDLKSVEIIFFENNNLSSEHYNKNRYEDVGACIFTYHKNNEPYLIFEDSYMIYMINLIENKCDYNMLNEKLSLDKNTLKAEVRGLIRQLNGEDQPERIYNC